MDYITNYGDSTRLAIFAVLLLSFAITEQLSPRRLRQQTRRARWASNISLSILSTITLKIALPLTAIEVAYQAQQNSWGALNQLKLTQPLDILAALLILDLAIYCQHIAFHKCPWLWRLHKVHHADKDFDVSTALRFHPFEILLSMVFKLACIVFIGADPIAVFAFEILLNSCAMFNHMNLKLPHALDRLIRRILVTPDMHRVHHSEIEEETNSNYGFSLSLWDRLFGTYIPQPRLGHTKMHIGLHEDRPAPTESIVWCILAPFTSSTTGDKHDNNPNH